MPYPTSPHAFYSPNSYLDMKTRQQILLRKSSLTRKLKPRPVLITLLITTATITNPKMQCLKTICIYFHTNGSAEWPSLLGIILGLVCRSHSWARVGEAAATWGMPLSRKKSEAPRKLSRNLWRFLKLWLNTVSVACGQTPHQWGKYRPPTQTVWRKYIAASDNLPCSKTCTGCQSRASTSRMRHLFIHQ